MRLGQVERCGRCGKTVWLRQVGVVSQGAVPEGTVVHQWMARKGSKPGPRFCSVSDGSPRTYHAPADYPTTVFGDPGSPLAVE